MSVVVVIDGGRAQPIAGRRADMGCMMSCLELVDEGVSGTPEGGKRPDEGQQQGAKLRPTKARARRAEAARIRKGWRRVSAMARAGSGHEDHGLRAYFK